MIRKVLRVEAPGIPVRAAQLGGLAFTCRDRTGVGVHTDLEPCGLELGHNQFPDDPAGSDKILASKLGVEGCIVERHTPECAAPTRGISIEQQITGDEFTL